MRKRSFTCKRSHRKRRRHRVRLLDVWRRGSYVKEIQRLKNLDATLRGLVGDVDDSDRQTEKGKLS